MRGFPSPGLHFLSFTLLLFVHPDNDCRSGITVISCFRSPHSWWTSATAQEADELHLHAVHLPAWIPVRALVALRAPFANTSSFTSSEPFYRGHHQGERLEMGIRTASVGRNQVLAQQQQWLNSYPATCSCLHKVLPLRWGENSRKWIDFCRSKSELIA